MQKAWLKGLKRVGDAVHDQAMRDMNTKIDILMKDKADRNEEKVNEEKERVAAEMNSNLYAQLMPAALPAPPMPGMGGYDQQQAYGQPQQGFGAQQPQYY